MTRLLIGMGVFLVAAHSSAQVAVPKGYSVGDIIVIDPVLCQVTEFVPPEPIPTICQKFTELGQSRGFLDDYGSWCVNAMQGKNEVVIREECERTTED